MNAPSLGVINPFRSAELSKQTKHTQQNAAVFIAHLKDNLRSHSNAGIYCMQKQNTQV